MTISASLDGSCSCAPNTRPASGGTPSALKKPAETVAPVISAGSSPAISGKRSN